jgi:hypothetical protein
MTTTQRFIAEIATAEGLTLDPRHVEAWMRSDHYTLCNLKDEAFRAYSYMTAHASAALLAMLEGFAKAEGL